MENNLAIQYEYRDEPCHHAANDKARKSYREYDFDRSIQNRFADYMVGHCSSKAQEAIWSCHSHLAFATSDDGETKKLVYIETCGNRFCPYCQQRKARKDAAKIARMIEYVQFQGKELIFITLTVPNVSGDVLGKKITALNAGVKKFMARKAIKNVSQGAIRKLEITRNPETGLFHPHIHLLMAVNKTYFRSKFYLNQDQLSTLWAQSMKLDTAVVDVRKAADAGKELAKYTAKSNDMLKSKAVFDIYYHALKGRQLITYSGAFKEAAKAYKEVSDAVSLDDDVSLFSEGLGGLELTRDREEKSKDVVFTKIVTKVWNPKTKRYDTEIRDMTPFEKAQFNSDNSRRFGRYWGKKLKSKRG